MLTQMTKAMHDDVGSIAGERGVTRASPKDRIQEYVDQSASKFVSAVDNFMTTPSVQAPNQQAAPSAAKELFSETALAEQEHQYEVVEIAPITLMSPEQVKANHHQQRQTAGPGAHPCQDAQVSREWV